MDWSKIKNDRAKRQEELSKQEELIARKKREILEKLNNKNNISKSLLTGTSSQSSSHISPASSANIIVKKAVAPSIKIEPTKSQITSIEINKTAAPGISPNQPIKIDLSFINKFKNDGSFLEQFKSLQNNNKDKINIKCEESQSKEEASRNDSITLAHKASQLNQVKNNQDVVTIKKELPVSCKSLLHEPSVGHVKEEVAISRRNEPRKFVKSENKSEQNVRVSVYQAEKPHSSKNTLINPTPTHSIEKEIDNAIKLARQESAREISLRANKREASQQSSRSDGSQHQASPKPGSSQGEELMSYGKMRWSSERTVDATKDPALCHYAKQVFGTTDLTLDQWKQLEDQRKMKALFEVIQQRFQVQPHQASTTESLENNRNKDHKNEKHKYAYDSDEEIDPDEGTWEHKKRRKEMEKTQQWAQGLTEMNKGRHHLGDYLPPHELEKFMKKWESIQSGNISHLSKSDYDEFKIQCDNLGYKMMLKLGWKEGQGLGSGEIAQTSIKEPIKATSTYSGAGLGSNDPTELKEDDDIYEAYRKRMMLAYRFRPNPLNNPRRPYY